MILPITQLPLKPRLTARKRLGERKLWAIIEPRSNTMRMGSHKDGLAHSARLADEVIWYQPEGLDWDLQPVIDAAPNKAVVARSLDDIIQTVVSGERVRAMLW